MGGGRGSGRGEGGRNSRKRDELNGTVIGYSIVPFRGNRGNT